MYKSCFTFIIISLSFASLSFAQGLFESSQTETASKFNLVEFNGYARGSAFGLSESYDYSAVFGEFCLQSEYSSKGTYIYADLRFREGVDFGKEYTKLQIKEAYAGYQSDKFDIYLGNQIITWGRTDGFNPTNNITPQDYFFLSANLDDQKLSNFLLQVKCRISSVIELEMIGIPFYSPSNYRFDLFATNEAVSYADISLPSKSFENSSVAARLNFEFSRIGFSASYFRGYNTFSGFTIQSIDWSTGVPIVLNSAKPHLKNTVGLDFALPISSWIIRGEIAYNITEEYEENIHIPNPDLFYVLGVEHNFWGFTSILQYVGRYTLDYTELSIPVLTDPTNPLAQMQYANEMIEYESALFNRKMFYQQEETNHAIVLSANKSFAYDTWNVELSGYYNISSEELMIRPKLTWKITDALAASLGGAYMTGPEKSIFNYSSPVLSGVFIELKAKF